MKKARFIALAVVLLMLAPFIAACGNKEYGPDEYTYRNSFSTSPSTWSPFTMQTVDDSYLQTFINVGLYEFSFNDAKDGYVIDPVMASEEPIDVTTEYKSISKWGIPSAANNGYAYKIKLNPAAKWDNGTQINADTWVNSYALLMDPVAKNYRAQDRIDGNLVIKNSKNYLYSGETAFVKVFSDYKSVAAAVTAGKDVLH